MPAQKLSVCMIVKNEETFIADCLKSVQPVADQIVVVDTGSTDKTIEIAKQYGAEVHSFKWVNDFAAARNASIKYAKGNWILWIDADERLLPESVTELKRLLKPERKPVAYSVNIKNVMADGKNFKISTGHRLFNNFKGIRFKGRVHEQIIYSVAQNNGEERHSNIVLYHLGYGLSLEKQKEKDERNRKLLLKMVKEEPNNAYAHFTLGQNYLLGDQPEKALPHYLQALKLKGLNRELRINVLNTTAETYLKLGDLQAADNYARQSLKQAPRQVSAYYLMYRIAEKDGRLEEATDWLKKLLEINRQSETMQRQIATDIQLNETDIAVTLADLLIKIGKTDEGMAVLQQAWENDRDNEMLFKRLLNALLTQNKWQEALQLLNERSVENDPDLLDLKGVIQIKQQNFLEAIRTYTRLLQLQPDNLATVKRLAGLFLKIGEKEKADQLMQMMTEISALRREQRVRPSIRQSN